MILAVNGTLMRGLALNHHLTQAGGVFVREAATAPLYRLWSIEDNYPAMIRVSSGGAEIAVELWQISEVGLLTILEDEPPGLLVGRVRLDDGFEVLGILAEPYVVEGQKEITRFGGWRNYLQQA